MSLRGSLFGYCQMLSEGHFLVSDHDEQILIICWILFLFIHIMKDTSGKFSLTDYSPCLCSVENPQYHQSLLHITELFGFRHFFSGALRSLSSAPCVKSTRTLAEFCPLCLCVVFHEQNRPIQTLDNLNVSCVFKVLINCQIYVCVPFCLHSYVFILMSPFFLKDLPPGFLKTLFRSQSFYVSVAPRITFLKRFLS